jgi:origin recognition complex subunit 1
VARKVAAVSGDARRALDICRRATQIVEDSNDGGIVTMRHVDTALQEMFSSPKIVAIRRGSVQEQTLLLAIAQDFRISGLEEAVFRDVYQHHVTICQLEGHLVPTTSELFKVASRLFEMRLILMDNNRCHPLKKIMLNVSSDDIDFALKKPVAV